nr:MAG TPA: hypothetical protein [Caudoviricetes sp.]
MYPQRGKSIPSAVGVLCCAYCFGTVAERKI